MGKIINSPFVWATQLNNDIKRLTAVLNLDQLDHDQKRAVMNLKRLASDVRLDARDYELSETRAQQLRNADKSKTMLEELRKSMLGVGEFGAFGPVDIAHLSAKIDEIISLLQ